MSTRLRSRIHAPAALRRATAAALAVGFGLACGPAAALADPGDPDPLFGGGDIRLTSGVPSAPFVEAEGPAYPETSRKIHVAGWRQVGVVNGLPSYGLFFRVFDSSDGSPFTGDLVDTGVRSVGFERSAEIVYTDFTSGATAPYDPTITVASAEPVGNGTFRIAIRRFDMRTGARDTRFNGGNPVTIATGSVPAVVDGLVVSTTGARRTIVGYTLQGQTDRPRLLSRTPTGANDGTFGPGGDGILPIESPDSGVLAGLAELKDGRLAVAVNYTTVTGPRLTTRTYNAAGNDTPATVSQTGSIAYDMAALPPSTPGVIVTPAEGGYALLTGAPNTATRSVELRTATGTRPTGFGDASGRQLLPSTGRTYASIGTAPDGRVYVGGDEIIQGNPAARVTRVSYITRPDINGGVSSSSRVDSDAVFKGAVGPCGTAVERLPYTSVISARRRVRAVGFCPGTGELQMVAAFEVAAIGDIDVTVTPGKNAAGREVIRANNLSVANAAAEPEADGPTVDAVPLRNIPLRNIPLRNIPLRNIPLRNIPLRNIPLRNIPLRNIPLRNIPLRNIPLRNIPLRNIPLRNIDWPTLLAGTALADASLDDLTFGEVLDLNDPDIQALTLDEIDLAAVLPNLTVVGLLYATIPLASFPTPTGGWCTALSIAPADCPGLDVSRNTFLDLEIAGYDLAAIYELPLPVVAATVRNAGLDSPLGLVRLNSFSFDETSLSDVPGDRFPTLCDPACPASKTLAQLDASDGFKATATVGDLVRLLPTSTTDARFPDLQFPLVLAEVIGGLLTPSYLALESAPLASLLSAADIRDTDLVRYDLQIDVDCAQIIGAAFPVKASPGTRVKPGTVVARDSLSNVDRQLPTPIVGDDGTLTFDADDSGLCTSAGVQSDAPAVVDLTFQAEPGVTLGPEAPAEGAAAVRTGEGAPALSAGGEAVDDSRDPGNFSTTTRPIADGDLYTGRIANDDDSDWFTLDALPNRELTVTATHVPGDVDIAVYGADPSAAVTPATRTDETLSRDAEARDPAAPAETEGDVNDPAKKPDQQQDILFPAKVAAGSLLGVSARRDTQDERLDVRTSSADTGKIVIGVRGYKGEKSALPYLLRATYGDAPANLPCITRPAAPGIASAAGAFPSLPLAASTKTLILVNRRRTAARFGESATATMMSNLAAYAARSEVNGVIVPIESDTTTGVQAKFAAWDADPCSTSVPQAIAKDITTTIDRVSAGLKELRHLVVVGSDDLIPQVRVPDRTLYSNEALYADEATVGGKDTPTSRALRTGLVLSDDPYGDFNPETYKAGLRYLPDLGIGRLLETPADVTAALQRYATANGRLDVATAYVSGYDFLKDGATQIADRLATAPSTVERQINDTADSAELRRGLSLSGTGVSSVNAHFSHTSAISAEAERAKRYSDVVKVGEVTPAVGRLLLSIGCHAGLNDPDSALGTGGVLDWAQKSAQARSVLIANTGFGYGDTATVAYSEQLAADLAALIASGKTTIGQALLFSKQQFSSSLLERTDYDVKASEEHTLYGLPTYRIGPNGTEAASVVPTTAAIVGSGAATTESEPATVTSTATAVTSPQGTFYREPGEQPVTRSGYPIQPKKSTDVTAADGARAHGVLLTGLVSRDIANVKPRVSRPVLDHSEQEPAPAPGNVVYPTNLTALRTVSTPTGLRDRLTVATGQYISGGTAGVGTQRLFDRADVEVLRSNSTDFEPPTIDDVTGTVTNGVAALIVTTTSGDASRGVILYRDNVSTAWKRVDLSPAGTNRFGAAVALTGGAVRIREFVVQLADGAGNVATASDKTTGFKADPQSANDPAAPKVDFIGALQAGVYRDTVSARLAAGESADGVRYSIDGANPVKYTGQFVAGATDGVHTLEVTRVAANGVRRTSTFTYVVDTDAPSVRGVASRRPDRVVTDQDGSVRRFFTSALRVDWFCADGGAGIATCPAATTLSGEATAAVATSGSASDRIGRTATGSSGPYAIDLQAPTGSWSTAANTIVSPTLPPVSGVTTNELRFSGADAVAGLADAAPTVTFTPTLGGGTTTIDAERVSCSSGERRSCTFRVGGGFPSLGIYDVRFTVTDRVGRTTTSAPLRITLAL